MPLFDHFDLLAPFYDRVIRVPEDFPIRQHLALPVDGWLLDAGGGTGRIADALADKVGQVALLDASIPMLQQSVGKNCCHPVAAKTEQLPFADETMDRIIVVDAFHHLADQELSLRRLWKVLKPAGRLVIEEPDIHHWGVRLVALAEKLALMQSHFLPGEQIADFFHEMGGQVTLKREGYTVWVIVDKAG